MTELNRQALEQVKLIHTLEPDFEGGKKGSKDCQCTYERTSGELEQSEKGL